MRGSNEIRVGVVVIVALVMLVSGYFFLRGVGLGADLYYMQLKGGANVSAGNDVRLQGVKVGQVKDVGLDPGSQKPVLTLAVKRNSKLLQTYSYTIRSSAIIGEQYVDIRGDYEPGAPVYSPNDESQRIQGRAAASILAATDEATTLIKDMQGTLGKFNQTLDKINNGVLSARNQQELANAMRGISQLTRSAQQSFGPQGVKFSFGDSRSQQSLNETLANAAIASREAAAAAHNIHLVTAAAGGNVTQMTRDMRRIVNENRGQVNSLLRSLSQAANNVSGLSETLAFLTKHGGLKENTQIALTSMRRAAENVEATTANFRALSADPATGENLRTSLQALRETTEALRGTTQSIQKLVTDNETQGQLKSILKTLNTTATTLNATSENLRDTTGGLKNVVGDPKFQEDLKGSAAELHNTLASAKAAADGFKNIAGDAQFQNDMKGSMAELRSTLAAARGAAESLSSVLGRFGRKRPATPTEGANSPSKPQSLLPTGLDFTYRHLTDFEGGPRTGSDVSGHHFGDINFNTQLFQRPVRVGIANIGEGSDFTLQSGLNVGRAAAVRFGLYRSKLGAGAEVRKGRFSLEGNAWDPNDHSYNAFVGVQVTPQVDIIAGRESIRGVRATSLGVRLRP